METHTNTNISQSGDSTNMKQCIENCLRCYESCTTGIRRCLSMGGKHASPEHILLMQSCARICNTSAELMMLGNKAHTYTCKACAEICEMCADDCEKIGAEMKECVEACRSCVESCEKMASH